IIATALALAQPLPPRERLAAVTDYLVVGMEVDRDKFLTHLQAGGYVRRPLVEERGDYSVRGGVIDFFPPLAPDPIRLEFWGDTVESIRTFHPASQRSAKHLEDVIVLPVSDVYLDTESQRLASHRLRSVKNTRVLEFLQRREHFAGIERYLPYFYEKIETLADYLPEDALLVNWDPLNLRQELAAILQQNEEVDRGAENWLVDWRPALGPRQTLNCHVTPLMDPGATPARVFTFDVKGNAEVAATLAASGSEPGRLLGPLAAQLKEWLASGFQVLLVCRSRSQAERLQLLLADRQVPGELTAPPRWGRPGTLHLTWDGLSAGFQWLGEALIVLTEEEVLGAAKEAPRRKTSRPLQFFTSLNDLQVGDAIVHVDHGIGLYRGLVKLTHGQEINDYLALEYLGGDKLYLPVDRLNLVQKYLGTTDGIPPLDRLGGKNWEKTKKRVRKVVEKIARELVELYAARQVVPGYQYSPPDAVLREFEATFEFEETPDQLNAIQEVYEDMSRDRPMDRLICGDVGYGKTEVALRAAFRAAMDGRQVAFLVPTTVLAEQHHALFQKRLQPYPLRVQVLSRFKSPKEQRQILAELAAGKIDIIIGTHRLLQKDVHFRDLGLLIIDEEQRFGVSHKEKLKHLRQNIDVLTLTATPIPRTLQMSMTGLREMSIINTPPSERLAIRTYLCRPDDRIIREAIQRELERGGQVFFVHNRVQNLASYAAYLQRLVPAARIAMAHGQMPEKELEDVMWRFWRREVDVLVCTAIIEAGLDIPAANTIIINRAHTLGLAQIYQLRGRVGRGREQAYAYLLVPEEEHLNREAQKRLKALMEFTELGSGFKIALHDLQIRGAGNMLGAAQSGHIAQVGYELYLQLLEEEINRLKGHPLDLTPDPEVHLPLAAYLPESYIPDIDQRLMWYRRLSGRLAQEEIDAITEELLDCYGPLAPEAANLLEVVRVKEVLRQLGIKRLDMKNGLITVKLTEQHPLDQERLVAEVLKRPRRYQLTPGQQLRVRLQEPGPPLLLLKNFLKELHLFVMGEKTTSSPGAPAPKELQL
ncbi:MAG: transcription-repair coupling factor, partial [Desulfobacca sp.]|uniref:transcription-repair coupling factor n=1 Tax=Desulfobacca sp. TaxID=2067990 RepID=UPI00404A75A3